LRCLAPTVLQARSRAGKTQRSRGDPAKPKHIGQHTGNCAGTSVAPPSRPRRRGVIGVWAENSGNLPSFISAGYGVLLMLGRMSWESP
jgi:hypothetical protein